MPVQFQTAIDPSYSPILYTPDYTFLKYVLDKKTQRYEQGLSAVSSAYSNLQKELSDPTLVKRREEYLKNAENQLQKIAGSDLSLQENVNVAQSIFDPIATDKAFIFDANATAINSAERKQMESWRDSDNLEERKKFNPLIYNWLSRDLDAIKNGNGDINNYKKGYEGRKAFAYVDAQDLLNQAAKDYGYETKQDIDGGMYIYGVKDGVKFRKSYKTFANEVLASNPVYVRQSQILGKSTTESIYDQAKSLGIDPKKFMYDYAEKDYTVYRDTKKKYITGIKEELDKEKKEIFAEGKNIDMSTAEGQAKMQELASRTAALEENYRQYNGLQYDYDNTFGKSSSEFDAKKAEYIQKFVDNPDGMFAEQYKLQDIDRFSNIKSATISTTIKENAAYFAGYKALNDARQTNATILNNINKSQTAEQAENRKQEELDWKEAGKPIVNDAGFEIVTTVNADGTTSTTKKPKVPEMQFAGVSATDMSKRISNINFLNSQLNLKSQSAIANLAAGADGGAISVIERLGVKQENVGVVRQFLVKQHNALQKDPSKPYLATKEEETALNDFFSSAFAMIKQSGNEEALNKIRGMAKTSIRDVDFGSLLDLTFKSMKITGKDYQRWMQFQDYQKATSDIADISNAVNKSKKAIVQVFADPNKYPEFSNLFVEKNGTKDLITADDIYDKLKNIKKVFVGGSGIFRDDLVDFTDEMKRTISNQYINGIGNVKVTPGYTMNKEPFTWVNGKVNMIINGKEYYYDLTEQNSDPKFPMGTKDYLKKMDVINSANINTPEFTELDVKSNIYASPLINLNGALKETVVSTLQNSTQFNSYLVQQTPNGDYAAVGDPEIEDAARRALTDSKNIKKVTMHTKSSSNNGGLAIEVTLRDKEKGDEGDHWGQSFYFPIDIMAPGVPKVIEAFSTVEDETEYNRIKKTGLPYDMYNFEKMGLEIKVVPNMKESLQGRIIFKTLKQDPTTKQFIPGVYETGEMNYDIGTQTYPELKQTVFQKIVNPYMTTKIRVDEENEKQTNTATTTATSTWGMIQQRLNNIK